MRSVARRMVLWGMLGVWVLVLAEVTAAGYFLWFSRTYYRPVYLEQRDDHWFWRTEHHEWGAWRRPSSTASHTHHCFSVSYASNAYGARDRERSTTATSPRAVVLGDSFIEGYAVDVDERLTNLLEARLGFEMLNFGMTHFGPLQYQILYDRLVRGFDHDAVIIGLLPYNDFVDNDLKRGREIPSFSHYYRPYYGDDGAVVYPRPKPDPDARPFAHWADAAQNRGWRQNLQRAFWLYGLRLEIATNVMILNAPTASEYVGYLENDPVRIANVVGSLRAIQRSAAPRPVLVAFLPDYKSWDHIARHPENYRQSVAVTMRAALQREGIATIDLLERFIARGLDKDTLYLPCDGHWNAAGHRAAFEVLHPIVDDLLRSGERPARPTS